MKLSTSLVSSLLVVVLWATSSHVSGQYYIRGAEIGWEQLNRDTFRFMVHVYKDCEDTNLYTNDLYFSTGVKKIGSQTISTASDVTPGCSTTCNTCTSSSCSFGHGISRYTLTQLVDVSAVRSLKYPRIFVSWRDGIRYTPPNVSRYPWFSVSANVYLTQTGLNNSPRFVSDPPLVGCYGKRVEYSYKAIDLDTNASGNRVDSVAYELSCVGGTCSNNAICPCCYEFLYCRYSGWGPKPPSPIELDESSGRLRMIPSRYPSAKDYIKVRVSEFRNGVKISELERDVLFGTYLCRTNSSPLLFVNQDTFTWSRLNDTLRLCSGQTLCLDVKSGDGNSGDSTRLEIDSDLPSAVVSKGRVGQHDSALICFVAKNEHVPNAPYTVNLNVWDNHCPLAMNHARTYVIYVDSSDFAIDRSFTEVKSDCGTYEFSASVPGKRSIDSIRWYLNDTVLLSDKPKFSYHFDSLGIQVVKSVVNSGTCQNVFYDTLDIQYNQQFQIAQVPDTALCLSKNLSPRLQIAGGYGSFSYEWSVLPWPATFKNPESATPEIIFDNKPRGEVYTVSYRVTDKLGCFAENQFKVNVKYAFVDDLLQDVEACEHDSLELKLPVNKHNPGTWRGDGVQNNWFYGAKAQPGRHYLSYYEEAYSYCSIDGAYITIKRSPKLKLMPDETVCEIVDTLQLWASPAGGTWKGKGLIGPSTFGPSDVGAGTYALVYGVTGTNGCSPEAEVQIQVKKNDLVVDAGADINACAYGQTLLLAVQPLWGEWLSGSPRVVSNGYEIEALEADTGLRTWIYHAKDSFGCENTDTLHLVIWPQPKAEIMVDDVLCFAGDTLLPLKAKPVGGQWLQPGVVEQGGLFFQLMEETNVGGNPSLWYVATSSQGCSDTARGSVFVDRKPVVEVKSLDLLCFTEDTFHPLEATPLGGSWTGPGVTLVDGEYGTEITDQDVGGVPLQFIYKYTTTYGCSDSGVHELRVEPAVEADFSIDAAHWFTDRYEVQFMNTSSAVADSFWWWFGNGDTSGLKHPKYVYEDYGNYSVSLKAWSAYCSDSTAQQDLIRYPLGVDGLASNKWGLAYRRSSQRIWVEGPENRRARLVIYDSKGKQLADLMVVANSEWALPEGLAPGVYLAHLHTKTSKTTLMKLLVD